MGLEPKHLSDALRQAQPVAPPTALAGRGDDRSIERLFRDEAAAIRRFVKRIVRHASDAEDLVQETFLRSWPALASGLVDCPRAFLFRAARNLALNHLRNSRVRDCEASRSACDAALKPHIPTAEDRLIALEEAAACRHLLDQLPLRCREAFVLRAVEEMSYKQMSRSMGLSVSTVEKHIGKGKQICRSLLADPARADIALEVLASRLPAPQRMAGRDGRRALAVAAE
jgi:RNA polymerase sigma factor (sigma-70 family)